LTRLGPLLLLAAVSLGWCATASADLADETTLAERYAPVVRLVEQPERCGPGEPYEPIDVDLLFGEPTVSLRGPWNPADLVKIAPSEDDLVGRFEYHLDFPGNALDPGCDYERWGRRLGGGTAPAVYAHVAADLGHPGQLALQYWFFYVYNDWNNLHEGDWEVIQLLFNASSAREALDEEPVAVGYSQHEGAERADWGDEKLELVDGRRPVVYPAAGSHANFFGEALHIGSSAEEGVGCDDTRGPHDQLDPTVFTIPSEAPEARARFPWTAFEGRWGELQEAFFNGPTGPNLKRQWTTPVAWSEGWRSRSLAVPTGGALGTDATDFFCAAIGKGSRGLVRFVRNPVPVLFLIGAILVLAVAVAVRATWRPVAPLRLARRRAWGQTLAASGRMYREHPGLFIGIGLVLIPVGVVMATLEAVVFGGFGLLGVEATGEEAGALAVLLVAIGVSLSLLGLGLVQAATACALVHLDEGRAIGPLRAYRIAFGRIRPLLGGLVLAVAVWFALSLTTILLPVALWLAVRWALLAQVVELEGRSGIDALRRSSELVRGRWLRVASLFAIGVGLVLAAGPVLGALLIVLTDAPLPLLNVVASVVYALAVPFVALMTSYVYFDALTRFELEQKNEPGELPAEIELQGRPPLGSTH
jgi:hypothetical protein